MHLLLTTCFLGEVLRAATYLLLAVHIKDHDCLVEVTGEGYQGAVTVPTAILAACTQQTTYYPAAAAATAAIAAAAAATAAATAIPAAAAAAAAEGKQRRIPSLRWRG